MPLAAKYTKLSLALATRCMSLDDFRIERIEVLIELAEIERRVREEEAAAAAITGIGGTEPGWTRSRAAHVAITQGSLDDIAKIIVLRLRKEMDDATRDLDEEDRAQVMEDDVKARAASLLDIDREMT